MTFVIQIPASSLTHLGRIRMVPNLQACETHDGCWLKTAEINEQLAAEIRKIPGAKTYQVLASNELIPAGNRLPQGYLPAGDWQPLSDFLALKLPAILLGSQPLVPLTLQLIPDSESQPAVGLLAPWQAWQAYAESAPAVRLAKLQFAVNDAEEVFLVGSPLPPIAGQRYWSPDGGEKPTLLIASGYRWSPAVEIELVRKLFAVDEASLVVWHADQRSERIARDNFVAGKRAAVRATTERLRHVGT